MILSNSNYVTSAENLFIYPECDWLKLNENDEYSFALFKRKSVEGWLGVGKTGNNNNN